MWKEEKPRADFAMASSKVCQDTTNPWASDLKKNLRCCSSVRTASNCSACCRKACWTTLGKKWVRDVQECMSVQHSPVSLRLALKLDLDYIVLPIRYHFVTDYQNSKFFPLLPIREISLLHEQQRKPYIIICYVVGQWICFFQHGSGVDGFKELICGNRGGTRYRNIVYRNRIICEVLHLQWVWRAFGKEIFK